MSTSFSPEPAPAAQKFPAGCAPCRQKFDISALTVQHKLKTVNNNNRGGRLAFLSLSTLKRRNSEPPILTSRM